VTETGDPPDKPEAVPVEREVPPTRQHSTPPTGDPPARPSQLSLDNIPTFPDDGPMARQLRAIDGVLGTIEQGFVFFLLALVVSVAALAAVHDKIFSEHLGRWWHYIVRGGTFAIAMFAAVFATQQQRHLSMDLISRRLSPRGRLILGCALKIVTIGIAALLFRSGLYQRDVAGGNESLDVFAFHINDADIVTTISIGAALIALHSVLHLAIDVEYLVRGKLPPERMRSGH
jgi:TRAP-type C4-dicarboxylate transport system permease small subunit